MITNTRTKVYPNAICKYWDYYDNESVVVFPETVTIKHRFIVLKTCKDRIEIRKRIRIVLSVSSFLTSKIRQNRCLIDPVCLRICFSFEIIQPSDSEPKTLGSICEIAEIVSRCKIACKLNLSSQPTCWRQENLWYVTFSVYRRDYIDGLFVLELLAFTQSGLTLILESYQLEMSLVALYY